MKDKTTDHFAWGDGNSLSALLMRPLSDDEAAWSARCIRRLFEGYPAANGQRICEFEKDRGFWRHPTERIPHFESTAWVLLACILAHQDPRLRRALGTATLDRHTQSAFEACVEYFDPDCGGWHWKLYQSPYDIRGKPDGVNAHTCSLYNGALLVWALTEARRLGVSLVEPPGKKALLVRSIAFLLQDYMEDVQGWAADYYPGIKHSENDYHDGLSFQIFWILSRAERVVPGEFEKHPVWRKRIVPDFHQKLLSAMYRDRNYPTRRHSWVVTRFESLELLNRCRRGDKDVLAEMRRARDSVEFFWVPWAYAAARVQRGHYARSTRERIEMQRALSYLLEFVSKDVEAGMNDWVFQLDELAIGLSAGEEQARDRSPEP